MSSDEPGANNNDVQCALLSALLFARHQHREVPYPYRYLYLHVYSTVRDIPIRIGAPHSFLQHLLLVWNFFPIFLDSGSWAVYCLQLDTRKNVICPPSNYLQYSIYLDFVQYTNNLNYYISPIFPSNQFSSITITSSSFFRSFLSESSNNNWH